MSLSREFTLTGIAVLLILICLNALIEPRHDLRNYDIFTEMMISKADESFHSSGDLPGGIVEQELVQGVFPRGLTPFEYGTGSEEAQRAGRELINPFSEPSAEELDRGRQVYGVYCGNCHGPDGEGHGRVVARGMLSPPSFLAARAMAMPDGEMFHVITKGQGNMKSHAAQVAPNDRWKVIRWIRSLQEGTR